MIKYRKHTQTCTQVYEGKQPYVNKRNILAPRYILLFIIIPWFGIFFGVGAYFKEKLLGVLMLLKFVPVLL